MYEEGRIGGWFCMEEKIISMIFFIKKLYREKNDIGEE